MFSRIFDLLAVVDTVSVLSLLLIKVAKNIIRLLKMVLKDYCQAQHSRPFQAKSDLAEISLYITVRPPTNPTHNSIIETCLAFD